MEMISQLHAPAPWNLTNDPPVINCMGIWEGSKAGKFVEQKRRNLLHLHPIPWSYSPYLDSDLTELPWYLFMNKVVCDTTKAYEGVNVYRHPFLASALGGGQCSSSFSDCCRVQLKCDDTRWRKGGEVKRKLANGVGSQYPSHYLGTWRIQHYYRSCAHLGCQ